MPVTEGKTLAEIEQYFTGQTWCTLQNVFYSVPVRMKIEDFCKYNQYRYAFLYT